MALQLISDAPFVGRNPIPPRAPLPADAAAYVDFTTGLHMTQAAAETGDTSSIALAPVSSTTLGYFYDQQGVIQRSQGNRWLRREFDALTGMPLGMRVDGPFTQRVVSAQRQVLTNGAAVGAIVAPAGAAPEAYQQWYSVAPLGAGEASLTFDTVAIATAGTFLYINVDVRAGGIVQVGSAGSGHANFNVRTGAIQAFDGARAQIIQRPGGAMTLHVRATVPAGGLENCAIYAASVAAMDTPKRGASGSGFEVISPRMFTGSGSQLPLAALWPETTSDTHAAEGVQPNYPGWSQSADFSVIATIRAGNLPQSNASLFTLNTGSTGVDLRLILAGTFGLLNRAGGGLLWDSGVRFVPGSLYRLGISRASGRLSVVLNGVGFETTTPTINGILRLATNSNTSLFHWSGHIEKTVFWADGRPQARLLQMMETWL